MFGKFSKYTFNFGIIFWFVLSTSTLILVGDADFICPPSQAHRMHNIIPNSTMHIFEHCGHYPFWEAPTLFRQVILEWIQGFE